MYTRQRRNGLLFCSVTPSFTAGGQNKSPFLLCLDNHIIGYWYIRSIITVKGTNFRGVKFSRLGETASMLNFRGCKEDASIFHVANNAWMWQR